MGSHSVEQESLSWTILIERVVVVSLVTYAVLRIIERILPGFVSSHFNLAMILFLIAIGTIVLFTYRRWFPILNSSTTVRPFGESLSIIILAAVAIVAIWQETDYREPYQITSELIAFGLVSILSVMAITKHG